MNTQPVISAVLFFATKALGRPVAPEQAAYHLAEYERCVSEVGAPFVTAKRSKIRRDDKIIFHFPHGAQTEYGDFSLYEAASAWLMERQSR